jgi:hypothetical protein
VGYSPSKARRLRMGWPHIEVAFGVQRRMADWSFEKAQTWDNLLAAHEKGSVRTESKLRAESLLVVY